MAAIQLNFTLRTSGNVKTVHLLGSWDNYAGQLPLSKDASKTGGWKSTFRFPATTMKQGQRYWYYYILDGYHVSHDPARESVVEPTTRRHLNILDIPASRTAAAAPASTGTRRDSRHLSVQVPTGRPLPASSIVSPTPVKPGQTRQIRAEQFAPATLQQLAARFAAHRISTATEEEDDDDEEEEEDSDSDSDVPSLSPSSSSSSTSSSRASSPTSSLSSRSSCSCERYGITRAGARVKLDCRGARCGYSDDSSDGESSECHSEEDDEETLATKQRRAAMVAKQQRAVRRQGMILRR